MKKGSTKTVEEVLEEVATKLVEQIQDNVPIVTGSTFASIKKQVSGLTIKVFAADHLLALEYGRAPTKNTGDGSVVANIEKWIKAKALDLDAFAVSKVIHEKGTRLYRGEDDRYPGAKGSEGKGSGVIMKPVEEAKEQLIKLIAEKLSANLSVTIAEKHKRG